MLRNYILIAVRNLRRYKGHSLMTILGLAIGIACCLLIFLYVSYELGYDRYHEFADRLYRVEISNWAATPLAVGPYLKQKFPDVEQSVRFLRNNRTLVGTGPDVFSEKRFFFADSSVFRAFTFPLVNGDPVTALRSPNSVVLTKEMAAKYFGNENPMGKRLEVQTGKPYVFVVSGIVENPSPQSHFRFDFLASFSTLQFPPDDAKVQWAQSRVYTYLLMRPHADLEKMRVELERAMHQRTETPDTTAIAAYFRPIGDIHLYSTCEKEIEPVSSIQYVYILSSIAVFVLVLAVINFINLSTAHSLRRAKEVAMRKTLGAFRRQLIVQFIGESILISGVAAVCAVGMVELVLPEFNRFTGVSLSLLGGGGLPVLAVIVAVSCVVGLAAGSYPAFYLSRYQPVKILRSGGQTESPASTAALLRNGLVIVQFAISIALIVGSLVIGDQMSFIQNRDLGMQKEQVVVMPVSVITGEEYNAFKAELLSHNAVAAVSASFCVPGERVVFEEFRPEGAQDLFYPRLLLTDFDFPETYGLRIKEGRSFSRQFVGDSSGAYLINEKAAAVLGWTKPVGKHIDFLSQHRGGEVVGVVKDFNFASLHSEVEPLVIHLDPNPAFYKYISLRLAAGDERVALRAVEDTWRRVLPGKPFEFTFLDDTFRSLYQSEMKLQAMVTGFTLVGIFVACLGLVGLVAHAVDRRTKEIGIRKVMGASEAGIVGLLSGDFLKLVLIANVLAWPVGWYAMRRWLEGFAYRVDISMWLFLLAGLVAVILAMLTMSLLIVKAARSNPVKSLRYE